MDGSPQFFDSKPVIVRVGTNPSQQIHARNTFETSFSVFLPDVAEDFQSSDTAHDYHRSLGHTLLRSESPLKEADAAGRQARHITETELFHFMQSTNDMLKQQSALLATLAERGTGIESSPINAPKRPSLALHILPDVAVSSVATLQNAPLVITATASKVFESIIPIATRPVQQNLPDAMAGTLSLESPSRKLFQSRGHSEINQSQFASPFDDAGFYSGSKHCGRRIDAIR